MKFQSGNFSFLKSHDPQLVRLGALAERYCHDDPNTCLIKLRQFGELLAQLIAAKTGLYRTDETSQSELLRRLRFERVLPAEVADLFHSLRISGNNATHGVQGTIADALNALKYARQAAVWFHRTFGNDPSFVAGPFQPPTSPAASASIHDELERFKKDLLATQSAAEQARLRAEENALARKIAEERARKEAEERSTWEQLAQEAEQEKQALRERLDALQLTAEADLVDLPRVIAQAEFAAQQIDLDAAATQRLIDQQLVAGPLSRTVMQKPEVMRDFLAHSINKLPGRRWPALFRNARVLFLGRVALFLWIAFVGFSVSRWLPHNVEQRAMKFLTLQYYSGVYNIQSPVNSDFSDEQLLLMIPDLMRLSGPVNLNLKGTRVKNIDELKRLKSLIGLDLENTRVANIDALKDLKSLRTLDLGGTRVSDINALRDLKSLTDLSLANTPVERIEALKDLKSLRRLDLRGTRVADIGALDDLKNLTHLSLANTPIVNIDGLKDFKSLTALDLGGTRIADIDALRSLENLTDLSLANTLVENIQELKDLKSLMTLDLAGTRVADLDALKDLKSVTDLSLANTPVANIDGLKDLKSLTNLSLANTAVANIDGLKDLKGLTELSLANTPVVNIDGLKNLESLQKLDLGGTPVAVFTHRSPL